MLTVVVVLVLCVPVVVITPFRKVLFVSAKVKLAVALALGAMLKNAFLTESPARAVMVVCTESLLNDAKAKSRPSAISRLRFESPEPNKVVFT